MVGEIKDMSNIFHYNNVIYDGRKNLSWVRPWETALAQCLNKINRSTDASTKVSGVAMLSVLSRWCWKGSNYLITHLVVASEGHGAQTLIGTQNHPWITCERTNGTQGVDLANLHKACRVQSVQNPSLECQCCLSHATHERLYISHPINWSFM
jgi:hypothetical protein